MKTPGWSLWLHAISSAAIGSNHAAIGKFLRERGILFCLDGIQTVGAWPTTVEHVDFLAADAHKWLLGPCAAGILFVRRDLQEKLNPPVYGWHNVRSPNFVAQETIEFRNDGRKFEAGTHNLLGLTGLIAAMELVLEIGVDNIAAELARKRAWLVSALRRKSFEILNPRPEPENASGITSIYRPGQDLTALHRKLTDAGIVTSLRADRKGQQYLRFSPHFYNTEEELNRAVDGMNLFSRRLVIACQLEPSSSSSPHRHPRIEFGVVSSMGTNFVLTLRLR